MTASGVESSPAHPDARQARNLVERALFALREIPLVFDREGVSQRLLRALADLHTALDTDLGYRAHYDALEQSLQALDESGQMLAAAGDKSQVPALAAALMALWDARSHVQHASSLAFPELMQRRFELHAQDAAPAAAASPFRASVGLPELQHVPRAPLPLPIDVEPIVELPSGEAPRSEVIATPRSFEELRALEAKINAGAGFAPEDEDAHESESDADEESATDADADTDADPLFAYEPAIEEREMLRVLARDALEDIASLGGLRKPIPTETWLDQAPFEQRLLDNLDYFVSLGSPALSVVSLYHAEADVPDAERAFAVAFALGSIQGSDCLHAAIAIVKQSPPEEMPGYAEGFALASNPAIDTELTALLDHPNAELAGMALAALARRRTLPESATDVILARNDPALLLALTRALPFSRAPERAQEFLEQLLYRSPTEDVLLATAESLLLLGHARTRDALRSLLDAPDTAPPLLAGALKLISLAGNALDVQRLLAAARRSPSAAAAAALGRFGHLQAVPLLIEWLESGDDALVSPAAIALERITGAGMFETVEEPWVKDLPPEAAEIPDLPNPMRQVQRVSADPAAWRAFWQTQQPKLPPELRYRGGRPFTLHSILDELEGPHTPIEQRWESALELRLASGIATRFSPDDWVARQLQDLAAIRNDLPPPDSAPGSWWFGGVPSSRSLNTARSAAPAAAAWGATPPPAAQLPFAAATPPPAAQLPFAAATPPPAAALRGSPYAEPRDAAPHSNGAFPVGDPPMPAPAMSVPELSLDQFATLSAEVDVDPMSYERTLRRNGITDSATWYALQSHWQAQIGADARLSQRWDELYRAAVDRARRGMFDGSRRGR